MSENKNVEFKKEIGVFGGISILGGIMIGGGIFYLGSYVLMRTGFSLGLAALAWVIGGIVCILGGLCLAELGTMLPKAGGFTVYLNEAFHPVVGFMSGFQSWLIGSPGSLSAGALAVVAIFGLEGMTGKIVATVILAVFTVINTQGVKTGSLIQNISMIAKLVPIFIIMLLALFMGDNTPALSMQPMDGTFDMGKMLSAVAFAVVATLWAYEGWTNLNTVAEEIKNPSRNLPLAIIGACVGIMALYVLFNYSIWRVLPLEEMRALIDGGELYLGTNVAKLMLGTAGGTLVTVGMVISSLGSINGMTLAFARTPYALAQEGHFFKSLGVLNPKTAVPTNALWVQFVISTLLIWIRSLDQLTSLVVFGGMIFNTLVFVGLLVLRKKMPDAPRPYKCPTIIVVITIIINIALMYNTFIEDTTTALMGLCVPVVAAAVYYAFDVKMKKEAK